MTLREELVKDGAIIESDTDSELVAHLLDRQLKKTPDLLQSVLAVLPRLHGAYAIVCVNVKQPETMVAFKNGPPLIVAWVPTPCMSPVMCRPLSVTPKKLCISTTVK